MSDFVYSDVLKPFQLKHYLFISNEVHNCINKKYFGFKYAVKKSSFIYKHFFTQKSPKYFRISNVYIHAYINYLKRNKKPVINLPKNKESEAVFNQSEMKNIYGSVAIKQLSMESYNKAINEIFKKHSFYANNIINKTEA